jgi:hypothetical protein
MDVYCHRCKEPWDTYHLRHEEHYEQDMKALNDLARDLSVLRDDRHPLQTPYYMVISGYGCPACGFTKARTTDEDVVASMVMDGAIEEDVAEFLP